MQNKAEKKISYSCRADKDSYPHDGRADKGRYRHDSRADKNPYRHDRRADSLSRKKHGIYVTSLEELFRLSEVTFFGGPIFAVSQASKVMLCSEIMRSKSFFAIICLFSNKLMINIVKQRILNLPRMS